MTWAVKLFKKKPDWIDGIWMDDLVLAVLETDKEIEEMSLAFVKQLNNQVPDEYDQVRLKGTYERMLREERFKQLVSKCKEMKK